MGEKASDQRPLSERVGDVDLIQRAVARGIREALLRHLTLCQLALTFAAEQAARLRGEKPGGDHGAGLPSAEHPERPLAGAAARHGSAAVYHRDDSVPSAPQPASTRITTKKTKAMSLS